MEFLAVSQPSLGPTLKFPVSNTVSRRSFLSLLGSRSLVAGCKCSALSIPSLSSDRVHFVEASKIGNLVPLYRCIFSDQLTPVLAYRCLVKEDDRETPSFLFDSFGQGFQASNLGRYSVVGCQPTMEIIAKEKRVTILDHKQGRSREEFVENPMGIPHKIMEGWAPQLFDELPDTFCGKMSSQPSTFPFLHGFILTVIRKRWHQMVTTIRSQFSIKSHEHW